jgi:hypothetical protein
MPIIPGKIRRGKLNPFNRRSGTDRRKSLKNRRRPGSERRLVQTESSPMGTLDPKKPIVQMYNRWTPKFGPTGYGGWTKSLHCSPNTRGGKEYRRQGKERRSGKDRRK